MGKQTINVLPSQRRLRELFSYDPNTGELLWRSLPPRSKRCLLGQQVGRKNYRGYWRCKIDGVCYPVHRVIWKMVTGSDPVNLIDHRNCNPSDNRWTNLREATPAQNGWNMRRQKRKANGVVKGVRFVKADRAWKAYIGIDGQQIYLGQFKDYERAVAVRNEAAAKTYGQFARIE